MPFLGDYNLFHKLLFFIGLAPFWPSSNKNTIQCTGWSFTYNIIFILIMFTCTPYVTYLLFYAKPIDKLLTNVYNIIDMFQMTTVFVSYDVTLVIILIQRHQQVEWLKQLNRHCLQFNDLTCDRMQNRNSFRMVFVLLFFYYVLQIFGVVRWYILAGPINKLKIAFVILFGILNLSSFAVATYVSHLALTFVRLLTALSTNLSDILSRDAGYQLLPNIVYLIDDILTSKSKFSALFGVLILVNSLYDIVLTTSTLYSSIAFFSYYTYTGLTFSLCLYVVPSIVKNAYLCYSMELLGRQVSR